MKLTKSQLILALAIGIVALFFALVFLGLIPGLRPPPGQGGREEVVVWGVFDDFAFLRDTLPGIPFRYERFPIEIYEANLVNALAAGRGPDVFMIHSTWLPKHFDKMAPLIDPAFTIANLRERFPTVVEQDFAPEGGIYALPLSIDTLALLYNRDHFDAAGIALPPATWVSFEELVPTLRRLDASGSIARAAAAIGGSAKSVNRATDLIAALLLQSGVAMTSQNFSSATFADAGVEPFQFYLSFANAANSTRFTWSDQLPYSLDAFAEEGASIIFNYSYQVALLREKNPFLRVGVAPFPQPAAASRVVTYPSYWGYAVSRTSPRQTDAWRFILDLTLNEPVARQYVAATKRPPALRTLIQEFSNDPDIGVFARQALTARSWPQVDNLLVERAFNEMVEDVLTGRLTAREAIEKAESAITARMQSRGVSP